MMLSRSRKFSPSKETSLIYPSHQLTEDDGKLPTRPRPGMKAFRQDDSGDQQPSSAEPMSTDYP